ICKQKTVSTRAETHAKDCGILRANTPLIQTGFVVTYFVIFTWVRSSFDLFCMCVMTALLTLYFVTYLHWDKDLSTAIYHAFGGLCYFTPILGALIADSWLGKFKTIIYLSIVYVIGHVVKSVGAIPTVGGRDVHIALSMLGLILIAFGTGGIKPCVAAFGGDQFEDEHVRERQKFFSIFYMSINAGSLLSTIITPILRGDVQCFGGDCYALAFGVPAALMVVALVVFIAGSGMYKKNPLQGNILLEVCNCVGFALRNRWYRSKHEPRRSHWLDWAEEKYSKRLIQEIKMVLRVLVLYIPLPMFWALFDQQVQEDKRQLYNLYTMHSYVFFSLAVLVKSCVSFLFCFLVIHLSFMYLLPRGRYSDVTCCLKSGECYRLDLGLLDFGAIYTIILKEESGKIVAHKTEDVKANNVHIAWQIPQYALITAGEVMFSITGLEFSYSQAPANMKSVLQAGWLLTVAFGNVIVLIVAEGAGLEQWKEFLLFASLLLGVCIIFSIMTCFYTYVNPEQLEKFYLENSGKEGDNNENMKKKNNDVPLKKTGKGTRL
uniref:Solute carrier family 15 member 2 n=1 Tax=Amphiprion ocellaris TaxID=80972 RepID=A0AAQ5X8H1_AMPOC